MSSPPNSASAGFWLLLLLCVSIFSTPAVWAVEEVGVELQRLAGEGWHAEGVTLSVRLLPGDALGFDLRIERLDADILDAPLKGVVVQCEKGSVRPGFLGCADARIRFPHPILRKPLFRASFEWNTREERLHIDFSRLKFARGRVQGRFSMAPGDWRLDLRAGAVDLAAVRRRLASILPKLPSSLKARGRADLHLQAWGGKEGPRRIKWSLKTRALALSEETAGIEGEGLRLLWKGEGRQTRNTGWHGMTTLRLDGGALLTPYFYLDPEVAPVTLETRFRTGRGLRRVHLDALRYRHGDMIRFDADASFDLAPFGLKRLELLTEDIPLRPLYENYLQPMLAETLLENVGLSGAVKIRLGQVETGRHLAVDVKNVSVIDSPIEAAPRFALHGLDGRLEWRSDGRAPPSYLRWKSARLLEKITIGAALAHFQLDAMGVHLLRTVRIPVLDGHLVMDRLSFDAAKGKEGRWRFEGVLTPISMGRLSKALGWPPLAGKLSGVIPGIAYEDGTLKVQGTLLVRIFDGRVRIRNLVLDDLLGYLPTLMADIDFHDIDLETLTSTFSFGKITGRLEGHVKGLYLEDWRPVAFDARLATPQGDRSRHRISQKAIDNISNIGGAGVSGALSRSFLGFFKEFNYDRLGISCRLENAICHMDGVAPAENGYYLVIGKGIPQISIKGFTRETDWNRLVDQLVEITQTGAPVIE